MWLPENRSSPMRRAFALALLAVVSVIGAAGAKSRPPDPDPAPPPAPKDIAVTAVTATTVSVAWSGARDSKGVVAYGLYRDGVLVSSTSSTRATVEGLRCAHAYTFGVDAVNAEGSRSKKQATVAAKTGACPNVTPPSAPPSKPRPPDPAPPQAPKDIAVTAVTTTTVSLAWSDAHDNKGVVAYGLYRDGVLVLSTSSTRATVEGLQCEHAYTFGVDAVDAAGNRSKKQATVAANTGTCPDATPPSVPRDVAVSAASATSISIAWTASTDNIGVTAYALFLDGRPSGSTTLTQATFSGLTCGRSYLLGVAAVDAAGNSSSRAEISASTSACSADLYVAPDGGDYAWSFVAAVYDATAIRLYVNGVLTASRAVTGSMDPSSGPLQIGGNGIWGEWFDGQIDNVRIYSRALSDAELGADMGTPVTASSPGPAPAGLVAAYAFDEGSGAAVADASGHGNVGTISGAAWAQGRYGSALTFDGADDVVTVADADSLDLSSAMTLEAWVHPSELGTMWRTAILKQAGNHLAYALYANTDTGQPSAHVFIGDDLSARGSNPLPASDCRAASAPCRSFDRAYHSAQPGQIVQVARGTYPEQTLLYDAAKEGATQHVVFQPASGGDVTIGGNINISGGRFIKGASHVTVRDMTLLGDVNLEGCGVPDGQQCPADSTSGSNDLTFQNLRVKGGVAFLCHSCSNVQILGGVWGPDSYLPSHGSLHPEVSPAYDAINFVKLKRPNHILIDGARFQNFARSTSSDHTECLQFEPADYVTIRNSVFTKCDTITLAFFTSLAGDSRSPAGYAAPDHIVLENNFIDQSYDATGGPTYNGLQIGECTNCVIRYNTWLQNAHLPCNAPCGEISLNNLVVGNLGPQSDCGNGGIVFSHNVFQGIACGPSDKSVADLGFVNPLTLDLHLLATSPAVDAGDPANFPATDIDGQHRPRGPAPDAGADEL